MSDLDKISSVFNAKIDSVKTKEDLQTIKTEFFGKNGHITQQFKSLGSLNSEKSQAENPPLKGNTTYNMPSLYFSGLPHDED
jgi:hypothetical protein